MCIRDSRNTPGGGNGEDFQAGGGGALGWKNNISVTPGQTYAVVVGPGGNGQTDPLGADGNYGSDSYFINTTTLKAEGGGYDFTHAAATYIGDGGGNGGLGKGGSGHTGGGGGAGGYTGNGGNGGSGTNGVNNYPTDGAGGAGAGGCGGSGDGGGGAGGGVGILGQGSSGTATNPTNSGGGGFAGGGGSGGADGGPGEDSFAGIRGAGGDGGAYGGGGGAANADYNTNPHGGDGADGAVRIIWGAGRAYPSTLTTDQTPVSGSTSSTGNRKIAGYALITLTYIGNNTWNIHGDGVF